MSLGVYNEKTAPLADFYEKEGKLMRINATSSENVIVATKEKCSLA